MCLNVCSYKVATTVCPCALCNKLLILKKKVYYDNISFKVSPSEELATFFILSNFFKYSFSNFLLSYSNNIFAVYFSSNSLLLDISAFRFKSFCFLYCTLLISPSLISFLNFFTNSIIFPKFSSLFQLSFSIIYLTKYFGFSLIYLLFNIFSTLYYFSLY